MAVRADGGQNRAASSEDGIESAASGVAGEGESPTAADAPAGGDELPVPLDRERVRPVAGQLHARGGRTGARFGSPGRRRSGERKEGGSSQQARASHRSTV